MRCGIGTIEVTLEQMVHMGTVVEVGSIASGDACRLSVSEAKKGLL